MNVSDSLKRCLNVEILSIYNRDKVVATFTYHIISISVNIAICETYF